MESKSLSALLNGITRHDYFDDISMTDEFLKAELLLDLSDDEFRLLSHKCRAMIKSLAMTDMDLNQAETFLASQARKRDGGISEEHSKVYLKFWKNNKTKIHDSLVKKCLWDNTLKKMSWRIDVKMQTRNTQNVNIPTAIVEMQLENKVVPNSSDVVRFEMDEKSLTSVLGHLKDIEQQIEKHTQQ